MHIVFKNMDEWFEKDSDLKNKFKDTYCTILEAAHDYAKCLNSTAVQKTGLSIEIYISEQLLKQTLIDAFDDLLRLKNYHPTTDPNPIKEMSYIVYWLLRHKPITLMTEEIVLNEKLKDIARARYLFINENFGVKLLMTAAFEGRREKSVCKNMQVFANKQLKYFQRFLLYYLVYRLDSPKSIEAILLGCTIHPIWEVNHIIWKDPQEPNKEF